MPETPSQSETRCPVCDSLISNDALCAACLLRQAALETGVGETGPPTDSEISTEPPTVESVAVAFPQLEIVERIGRGGMGTVFKARLSHPNIVTVHDFGQSGGFYYLMMEFVDGVNLRQAIRSEHFTPEQTLSIVLKALEKERERRQQSAGEMKTEIETAVKTASTPKKKLPLWRRIVAEVKTWPIWATILVGVAVICFGIPALVSIVVIAVGIIVFLFGDLFEAITGHYNFW